MGFLGFGSSPSSAPDPGIAPDRSQRAKCWAARDDFFACLDANGIQTKTANLDGEEGKKCGKVAEKFKQECKGSWVDYFIQKREVDRKKEELMKKIEKEKAERIY